MNNTDIFELRFLCYISINVETNNKIKKQYCNIVLRCVFCGDQQTCIKSKDFSAKCTLCFSDHPMNHRGCPSIKNIQNHRNHHSSQANKNNFNDNIRHCENNNDVTTHSNHNITSKNRKTQF